MRKNRLQKNVFVIAAFLAGSLLASCSNLSDLPNTTIETPTIVVSTLAGGGVGNPATVNSPVYGSIGSADGVGKAASFYAPADVVLDASGNLYVSDSGNHLIRKVSPLGVVTTFAGNTAGGFENGKGTAASFSSVQGLAIDASGNIYVADPGNEVIRKITADGTVTTFAGTGVAGADNGPVATATFKEPAGLAFDAAGNLYVADFGNKMIRKITTSGVVSTLAGSGAIGYDNGTGSLASFTSPTRLVVDASGNIYVSDLSLVRKITPDGIVISFAGNAPPSGYSTRADGKGAGAGIVVAGGISIDSNGVIYLGDQEVVRAIKGDGTVTTIAGGGTGNTTDGAASKASFGALTGLVVNKAGTEMYVADTRTSLIRQIALH